MDYMIFDANPAVQSGTGWYLDDSPSPEDHEDAESFAEEVLDRAVVECDGNADYSVGDTIYVLVYCDDGSTYPSSRTLDCDDFTADDSDISEWDSTNSYVECCYGCQGDEPGTVEVQIGATRHGAWYVRTDDGTESETVSGPFATQDEAETAAEAYATEHDEAPDLDDLVSEIIDTEFFGPEATEEAVTAICEAMTVHSQGYLLLPAGEVPGAVGPLWTINGYLECDHIQVDATHDSTEIAAFTLLRGIQQYTCTL